MCADCDKFEVDITILKEVVESLENHMEIHIGCNAYCPTYQLIREYADTLSKELKGKTGDLH